MGMDPTDVDWPEMNVRLAIRERRWADAALGAFLWGIFAVVLIPYRFFVSYRNTLRGNLKERALKIRKWLSDKIDVEEMRQAMLKRARNPFPDSPLATAFYEYEKVRTQAGVDPITALQKKAWFLENLLSVEKDAQKLYVLEDMAAQAGIRKPFEKEPPLPRRREAILATRAKRAQSKDRSDK